MLIIARKENQKVRIGDDIEIMIIEIRGKDVRLGITAPKDINVVRSELDYYKKD